MPKYLEAAIEDVEAYSCQWDGDLHTSSPRVAEGTDDRAVQVVKEEQCGEDAPCDGEGREGEHDFRRRGEGERGGRRGEAGREGGQEAQRGDDLHHYPPDLPVHRESLRASPFPEGGVLERWTCQTRRVAVAHDVRSSKRQARK